MGFVIHWHESAMALQYTWLENPHGQKCLVGYRLCSAYLLSCVQLFRLHGLQHTRLPCVSPSPKVCSNSCPLIWWCHPIASSSVISFSSFLQSFPASGSIPMSWHLESSGQSTGASASASVLQTNIHSWFPLGLTPCSLRDSQEPSPEPQFKGIKPWTLSLFYCATLISVHDYWKSHSFDYTDLCRKSNVSAF